MSWRKIAFTMSTTNHSTYNPKGDKEGVKVSAVQMNTVADIATNLERAKALIGKAKQAGANLVVLPENFAYIPVSSKGYQTIAEPSTGGQLQDFLAAQAQDNKIFLVGGTIPIKVGNQIGSVSILYSDTGQEVARYHKIHLFDIDLREENLLYKESAIFAAGEEICVAETPFGRLGLAVCYDMRFPELFRRMSAEGVDLITLPSAFTCPTGQAHWHSLLRARAIENQASVIAAAQTGTHDNGRQTYGHSMIINSWGTIISELDTEEGTTTAEFDLEQQNKLRRNFPCLKHRVIQ